jgi:hypothetical protein
MKLKMATLLSIVLLISIAFWQSLRMQARSAAPQAETPRIEFVAVKGSPYETGPMTGRPAAGDLNGDRIPDIVVACGAC